MKTSRVVADAFADLSIDELKALLHEKNMQLQEKDAELHEKNVELETNRLLLEQMKLQILKLKKLQFGQRSEKRAQQIEQLELWVETLEILDERRKVDAEASIPSRSRKPKSSETLLPEERRHRVFPVYLPREIRRIEPTSCACPDCGKTLKPLGEDICEFLELEPLRFKVIQQIRPKLACSGCDTIVQESAPSRPIPRGIAGPGLLAHVVVSKYGDHTPLYRQSEIYAREGIDLDRSLLSQWVGHISSLLAPLTDTLRAYVFDAEMLHADDTPLPVLAPGSGKTKTGRIWTYVRDERPVGSISAPAVWFAYSPDRKGVHPQEHLKDFSGILHADGYSGYVKLYDHGKIIEAACFAHARRKFVDLNAMQQSPIATEILDRISELYVIEKDIRGQSAAVRRAERQARSRPLLDALHGRIQELLVTVSQKSAVAQAIRYSLTRWKALTRYCDDGRIEIDNNAAERSLRCVALGRKNFMFAGSDKGGEHAAALYSLIGTAKLNGMNPEAYLREVLTRISDHPISKIAELLPWNLPTVAQYEQSS